MDRGFANMCTNDGTGAAGSGDDRSDWLDQLKFEQVVQHFAAGYENSQSVVRFLETKAAAVLGGVPVILGGLRDQSIGARSRTLSDSACR